MLPNLLEKRQYWNTRLIFELAESRNLECGLCYGLCSDVSTRSAESKYTYGLHENIAKPCHELCQEVIIWHNDSFRI